MHLSLLCRLKAGTVHQPCSGGCDAHWDDATGEPCPEECGCECHRQEGT
jgi:hypothetical protein